SNNNYAYANNFDEQGTPFGHWGNEIYHRRVSLWAFSFALRLGERMIRAIGFVRLFPLRCCCHGHYYFHRFFHSRSHCWCANVWLFVQELNTSSKRWPRVKENKLRDRRRVPR